MCIRDSDKNQKLAETKTSTIAAMTGAQQQSKAPPPPKASPEVKKSTNELKQSREKVERLQTQLAAAGVTGKGGKGGGKGGGKSNTSTGVSKAKHALLDSFTKEDWDNVYKQKLCAVPNR